MSERDMGNLHYKHGGWPADHSIADEMLEELQRENARLRERIRAALMLNSPRQKDKTLRRALGETDK